MGSAFDSFADKAGYSVANLLNAVSLAFPHHDDDSTQALSDRAESAVELAVFVGAATDVGGRLAAIGVVVPYVAATLETLSADPFFFV